MSAMFWVVFVYLGVTCYLGYLGYRHTRSAQDYLIAGRKMHPAVMALSYGATFISTSAIVGFGGAAAVFGMSLQWLTFLNVFVGILIAFVVFGGRTRRLGHQLDAHTFPEFLGRRYDSKFIQVFAGLAIFAFMPLYAGAVLIGAAKCVAPLLQIEYNTALFFFALIVFVYVFLGGLKAVMYTDAFQATVMLAGMVLLLWMTYAMLGGVVPAHEALTAAADKVPPPLVAAGHQGWTRMPAFLSSQWWTVVSTIILGVGIGVLAQPQLIVRFMTVKSQRELNRAVLPGGIFILFMPGVAYTVGALTNVYFLNKGMGPSIAAAKGDVEQIIPMFIAQALPSWFGALFMVTLMAAAMSTASSQFHTMGAAMSRDVYERLRGGRGNSLLINRIGVFVVFVISLIIAWGLPRYFAAQGEAIVARGTAIFFGLCAAAFLPAYLGALYSKRVTRAGAAAGIVAGFAASTFWLVFVHGAESKPLLICQALFGRPSLLGTLTPDGRKVVSDVVWGIRWADVDPLIVALPLSILVTVLVTCLTRPQPGQPRVNGRMEQP